VIRFEDFEVNVDAGELSRRGVRIKLQEQPFRALVRLVEQPGEVVTREDLQKRLWPADTTVDFDRGLNKAINRLREALGDDAERPRFIETLPLRGYRFLAHVDKATVPPTAPPIATVPSSPPQPRPGSRGRFVLVAAGALTIILLAVIGYRHLQAVSPPIESIAVLPLENLSNDPAQEFFSDGLTDELIGELARIGSLRVISRTSIMQYKHGSRKSLPEIARDLNVDAIVEGTVLQAGDRVRITAQLIRASDDRHLWADKYERDLTDILSLQGEVARAIAGQIKIKLTPYEQSRLTQKRQVNPDAYEAYLKGNYFLVKGVPGIARSIAFFQQAIKLDPSQAEAHAGLAQALCFAAIFGLRPSSEIYPEARIAALKALELDPSNVAAHNALANVKDGYDWDLAGGDVEYKRAMQSNPSHLLTRLWYAEHLGRLRRFDEAIAESSKAMALDPVSPISLNVRAMIFFRAGRYDEAILTSQQALDLDPSIVNSLWWQGLSYAGKHDYPKAIATLQRAVQMNDGPLFQALLGHVYGISGDRTKALQVLGMLGKLSKERYVSPVDFAVVYAGLGDADSTFEWLEKAYDSRASRIQELGSFYFQRFHADPRYKNLLYRVGLTD
jgi:TolB-like protein/DNA-binding winged helix-turn-helix (wHTH) protein